MSPMSPALAGGFFTTKPPGKSYMLAYRHTIHLENSIWEFTLRIHWESIILWTDSSLCVCVCVYLQLRLKIELLTFLSLIIMQGPLLIYTSPFSSDPHSYPLPLYTPTLMNTIDILNCVCVYVKCMLFYMHLIYTNTIVLCYKSCSIFYALFHTRSAWVALFTSGTSELFPSITTRS